MPYLHESIIDREAALKRLCFSQILVGLSALASTAVLLVQLVPPLFSGSP
jgi:hypothetical protein